ncbi:MAG: hypothetical protein WCI30_09030 [Clostridia bacterium]
MLEYVISVKSLLIIFGVVAGLLLLIYLILVLNRLAKLLKSVQNIADDSRAEIKSIIAKSDEALAYATEIAEISNKYAHKVDSTISLVEKILTNPDTYKGIASVFKK